MEAKIGFHLHPHPLDWLHLESSFATVTGKLKNGEYLPLIPANNWTNTFRVEFEKEQSRLKTSYAFVSLQSVFAQDNNSEYENTSKGYNLLNLGFGGKISLLDHTFDISISANNILNENYIAHLSRLKPDGISNIGRNISIGIRVPIG